MIEVDAFTTLVVRTANLVYRIAILTPHAREVLGQGGKFFPERTRAVMPPDPPSRSLSRPVRLSG